MATTILIANPCDAERKLLGQVLDEGEFTVIEAASIREVLEQAGSHSPALIVLDGLLWQGQALEALRQLKKLPAIQTIPVMIFANPGREEEVYDAIQAGASAWFLRKGFEIDKFLDKVRTTQGRHEVRGEPGGSNSASSTSGLPTGLEKLSEEQVLAAMRNMEYPPAFTFSINEAVTTPCARDQEARHIAEIAVRDPMMMTAVLSRAARMNLDKSIDGLADVHEAAEVLGMREFAKMAESLWPLEYNLAGLWDPGCFWMHSVATARIAGHLSKMLGLKKPGQAISAALLHDFGYYILATLFPKHYGALFSASGSIDSIHPVWEKRLIGTHHGEVADWALRHFNLPELLRSVANVHHVPGIMGQPLSGSARVLSLIVQAADQIADALFPGDPPLTCLTTLAQEFIAAFERANLSADKLMGEARKIMAELTTELVYLFPQSASRSYVYKQRPLGPALYFAPHGPELDIIKTYCNVRAEELVIMERVGRAEYPVNMPMVLNLIHVDEPAAQVETLSTIVASGLTRGRKGVVLLGGPIDKSYPSLVGEMWQLHTVPTQPATWLRMLTAVDTEPMEMSAACAAE
ncbi:MAG: HDOD domain-containing protein [Phycisphaerales bacterium]|nr:HDOD domain-containing protein [Phycisphaerales bacterium]